MNFKFDEFLVDTDSFELLCGGRPVKVEPQVLDLLILLARNSMRVVSKGEIIDTVWNGRAVSEATVNSRVMSLRRAIGDDGSAQNLVRTVRSRGYRLIVDVEVVPPACEAGAGCWNNGVVDADASSGTTGDRPALDMPTGPKIALLGFEKRAADETAAIFCDAIVDGITAALIRFTELHVLVARKPAPNGSALADPIEISESMGAEYVLQGSLQCAGNRSRISVYLTSVADRRALWSQTYDVRMTSEHLFEVHDSITSNVVAAIASVYGGVIAREAIRRSTGGTIPSFRSYEATVRALDIMTSGFTADSHLETRRRLDEVIATDPHYSSAWAMLAWTHSVEHTEGHNRLPDSDPRDRALQAAQQAIVLDPENPIAHFAMARAAFINGDVELFRQEADTALLLNPHEPFLLGCLGNWLAFSGAWEEGTAMATKAIALRPNAYPRWWHAAIGKNFYRQEDYLAALAEFNKINLPKWWWNQVELSYTYGQMGDMPNARAAAKALRNLYPGFNLRTAVMEHRKFNFRPEFIALALDGLRKAGIPE